MKNPLNHTTRRSFIKKSTAAALAAVNVTVFSGLINAAEGGGGTGTGAGGTTGWFTTGSSGTTGWFTTGGGGSTTAPQQCTTKRNKQTFRHKVVTGQTWAWHCIDKVECLNAQGSYVVTPGGGLKWWTNSRPCSGSQCSSYPETSTITPYCA